MLCLIFIKAKFVLLITANYLGFYLQDSKKISIELNWVDSTRNFHVSSL